jgi:hypothetical protein
MLALLFGCSLANTAWLLSKATAVNTLAKVMFVILLLLVKLNVFVMVLLC